MNKADRMEFFKNYTPTFPTKDELHEQCLKEYNAACTSFIDKWHHDLRELVPQTKLLPIDAELLECIYADMGNSATGSQLAEITLFTQFVANAIRKEFNGRPVFYKLNSRSPKDICAPKACISDDADEILKNLFGSMRTQEDFSMFYHSKMPCFLVLQTAVDIDPAKEWRAFIKDGKPIGITQYNHDLIINSGGLEKITFEFNNWFKQVLFQPLMRTYGSSDFNVVLDFHITHLKNPNYEDGFPPMKKNLTQYNLIEINPYGLSDPCLFRSYDKIECFIDDWRGPPLVATVRF